MAVIPMEFTILSSISLRVWVVGLLRPPNRVSHNLHDSHTLNGFDVEVVFRDTGVVSLAGEALIRPNRQPIDQTILVVCGSLT